MGQLFYVLVQVVLALILGVVLVQIGRNVVDWHRNNHASVETARVKVIAKRQNFLHSGNANQTLHYVTFELPDGQRQELRVRSEAYGQLIEGDVGELTYQGTRYHNFQRINVKS